ncbi:MAG: helicase, partial [Desulfobacterales bacterium]|nr:helicase [Desulfobacterales bacterium]
RNLDLLHEKLKSIVIRRRKEEVLSDLPDEVVNNYYLDLTPEQAGIHGDLARKLMPLLNKKYLTPVDFQRLMTLLLRMRMVCDSTYLIDRETNLSPKLKELAGILDELVLENGRKVVIFSEWTTMTYLIAKQLSNAGIPFVELSGKIPVKKRQALIDEFSNNPDCKVFLSTDAGGTGLNLQAADCVINFELPWNPAKMNQRIGRVNRIGQESGCVNVVNLITKNSIEEKILAGLQLKTDLFEGVFDGGRDKVEFSRATRAEPPDKLKAMIGEDMEAVRTEGGASVEIPEETPHFLNPEVLAEDDPGLAERAAERASTGDAGVTDGADATDGMNGVDGVDGKDVTESSDAGKSRRDKAAGSGAPDQSPEKMEKVLNTGMQFISGLLEMATGRKIETTDGRDRMIRLDKDTGEVTMKFKLPGF